jgi:hypothetical protein
VLAPARVLSLREEQQRRATYVGLVGLFLGTFGAFSLMRPSRSFDLKPLDLVMLGLSTFRLGRLAAYDPVVRPRREPFTETGPDRSGAGDTTEPEGRGARRAIGELIACPTCAGTWLAAAQVYALHLAPGPARMLIAIMASVGMAELLGAAVEALGWSGLVARQEAGEREKERERVGRPVA